MKFLKFLDEHKTKISGVILVAVGSLQTNAAVLKQLMTPEQFAYFTIAAGVIVAVIGSINTARQRPPNIETKK